MQQRGLEYSSKLTHKRYSESNGLLEKILETGEKRDVAILERILESASKWEEKVLAEARANRDKEERNEKTLLQHLMGEGEVLPPRRLDFNWGTRWGFF